VFLEMNLENNISPAGEVHLVQDSGINIAGMKNIINIQERLQS
jgi:hypothetical protein